MSRLLRFCALAVSALLALPASAVQRTFVASFGLDTNPCSVTSPCRSFAAAMAATDANGEVIVLDSAGYGAVTITQAVSLIAPEGVYAGISVFAGQNGVTVSAGPSDRVVLRGLTVNGQGGNHGIRVVSGNRVLVERCTIANMALSGIRIEGGQSVDVSHSLIYSNMGHGIHLVSGPLAAPLVHVNDSRVTRNQQTAILVEAGAIALNRVSVAINFFRGLHLHPAASTTVEALIRDSEFSDNIDFGVMVNPRLTGTVARATVERTSATGNGSTGFFVSTEGVGVGQLYLTHSVSSNAGQEGVMSIGPGAFAYVTGSTLAGGSAGLVQASAGTLFTCGDNKLIGNAVPTSGTILPLAGCTQ